MTSRRSCLVNYLWLFLVAAFLVLAQSLDNLDSNPLSSSPSSSWKDWNYYQLLDLQSPDYYYNNQSSKTSTKYFRLPSRRERRRERSQIKASDVKKAYRKQAQLWHPDKITSRKKQQLAANNTVSHGIDYQNITVEECNARFAKIAEAYEVLIDDGKREDYDVFLLDAEEEMEKKYKMENFQKQGERPSSSFSSSAAATSFNDFYHTTNSFFQDFFQDPMSTFEEFFFGQEGDDVDSEEHTKGFMEDLFESFYGTASNIFQQQKTGNQRYYNRPPDRISETTQVSYDTGLRREVLQVIQREEYDEPQENKIYFRVIAQEFVEESDLFYGHSLGYTPISEPYIVKEGYLPYKEQNKRYTSNNFEEDGNRYGREKSSRKRQPLSITSHRLEKYEYMTPKTIHLHSKNGEYYAGLTIDCELVIMHDKGPFEEDVQVWTSYTYVPPNHQNGCALAMYGPTIAIIVGNVENPTTVLWTSPPPPPIVPGSPFDGEEVIDYYCSLDDDGSLAVYRTRKSANLTVTGRDILGIVHMWWSDLVTGDYSTPPKTQAAHAWKSLQRWAHLKITGKPGSSDRTMYGSRHSNSDEHHVDECIYATGPAGCYTAGRYVVNISTTIKRSVGKIVSQLDGKVGELVDSLYEGAEEDVDLLDTMLRITTKSIRNVSLAIVRFLHGVFPHLLRFLKEFQYRISKWTKILRYEINECVDKSSYKLRRLKRVVKTSLERIINEWET
mmetsp:Transcript_3341/g.6249  ORF Transcript_3341/g.6249 Transcript_3341/m.6249 type:complete len:726 (+) Transcript_3341:707-2884(+)